MAKVTADFQVRLTSGNVQNQISQSPRVRGDIVQVKIRPHKGFGRDEGPPNYTILTVEDIEEADAIERVKRNAAKIDPQTGRALTVKRASHRINLDALSNAVLAGAGKGAAVVSKAEFFRKTASLAVSR